MIPRTDGGASKAYLGHLKPDVSATLRESIVEAIGKSATLATESAVIAAPQGQEAILQAAEASVESIAKH